MPGFFSDVGKALGDLFAAPARRRAEREQVWQTYATELRGAYQPPLREFLRSRSSTIDVVVGDIAVHIDVHAVTTGKTTTYYTRFRACFLLPQSPSFKVYRTHFLSSMGDALGFQDVELGGDPVFDRDFVVKTSHPEATRRAFTPAVKDALSADKSGTVRSDGHTVTFTLTGIASTRGALARGTAIVSGLANYGADWLVWLRSVPSAQWVSPTGGWDDRSTPSVRVMVGSTPVWLYPTLHDTSIAIMGAAEAQRPLASFELDIDGDGALQSEPPDELLQPANLEALRAAGASTLSCDGRYLRLVLQGDIDERRLAAVPRLLAGICAEDTSLGAFR